MTSKDYQLIANAFKESREHCAGADEPTSRLLLAIDVTAMRVANALKEDNPNFNVNKFLDTCGVSDSR